MDKIKDAFVLELIDRHSSGLSKEKLNLALTTLAKFTLQGVFKKLDPGGRIPIEDCNISVSSKDKSAILTIQISAEREKELASAVAAVYKDLLGEIDRWGIEELINAGHKAYS